MHHRTLVLSLAPFLRGEVKTQPYCFCSFVNVPDPAVSVAA